MSTNENGSSIENTAEIINFADILSKRIGTSELYSARNNRFKRIMFADITDDTGHIYKVSTSNISFRGMAAIGDTQLCPGENVKICIGNQEKISAVVIWKSERKIGFKFGKDINLIQCLDHISNIYKFS